MLLTPVIEMNSVIGITQSNLMNLKLLSYNCKIKAKIFCNLATINAKDAQNYKKVEKAHYLLNRALSLNSPNSKLTTCIQQNLAAVCNQQKNFSESLKHVQAALDSLRNTAKTPSDSFLLSDLKFNEGFARAHLGETSFAIEAFTQAHKHAFSTNQKIIYESLESIGDCYAAKADLEQAVNFYESAIDYLAAHLQRNGTSGGDNRVRNRILAKKALLKSPNSSGNASRRTSFTKEDGENLQENNNQLGRSSRRNSVVKEDGKNLQENNNQLGPALKQNSVVKEDGKNLQENNNQLGSASKQNSFSKEDDKTLLDNNNQPEPASRRNSLVKEDGKNLQENNNQLGTSSMQNSFAKEDGEALLNSAADLLTTANVHDKYLDMIRERDQMPTTGNSLETVDEEKPLSTLRRTSSSSGSTAKTKAEASTRTEENMEALGDKWTGWMNVAVPSVNDTWESDYNRDSFKNEKTVRRDDEAKKRLDGNGIEKKIAEVDRDKKNLGRSSKICTIS